ncbi:MAG: histidine kinase [Bacteroidota bacterium]
MVEAEALAGKDPKKALQLLEEALNISYDNKDRQTEGLCHNALASINLQLGNFPVAIEQAKIALDLLDRDKNTQGYYRAHQSLAKAYDGNGESDKALEHYFIFLNHVRSTNQKSLITETDNRIAAIYLRQQKFTLAQDRYRSVLDFEQKNQNLPGMITAYNNIGQACNVQGDSTKALEYFQKAAELTPQTRGKKLAKQSYDNLYNSLRSNSQSFQHDQFDSNRRLDGEEDEQQVDLTLTEAANGTHYFANPIEEKKVLEVLEDVAEANEESGNIEGELNSRLQIGRLLLDNRQSQEAVPYLEQSVSLAEKIGDEVEMNEAQKGLVLAYEDNGDFSEAFKVLKDASVLESKILRDTIDSLKTRLENIVDLGQQIDRISERMKEKDDRLRKQKMIVYSLTAGLLILLISALLILRSNRARQRANQLLALKSLRSQMNPHFIFNSLNSVNSFISKNDDRSANKYLADFSKLMRAVLENSQEDFVPLTTEIKVLELYLGLEYFRFKDKFSYEFTLDPDLDPEGIDIPPMLIQPYIENAIWHGLRYKESPGMLWVSMRQESDNIRVIVEDNGIGRERSQAVKTANQREHQSTGMKNTAARLQLIDSLYRRKLNIQISDREPEAEDVGTRVEICIPIRSED